MIQTKAELFTVRKDYEKLDQEQQRQGIAYQKYKTLAQIGHEKQKKLTDTVDDVKNWLSDFKRAANYDDANSSTMSNSFVVANSDVNSLSQADSQKQFDGSDGLIYQKLG